MPRTRHRISGVIEEDTPQHVIDHPVLGAPLELIGPDDKPLVPELVSTKHAETRVAASRQTKSEDKDDK